MFSVYKVFEQDDKVLFWTRKRFNQLFRNNKQNTIKSDPKYYQS